MLLKDRHIDRHIVVFESDDWGSIRMPSSDIMKRLQAKGILFRDVSGYDLIDSLASNDDLEMLMEVLSSVKDGNGKPAKLTLNCVTANPNFEKIRESNFQKYFYEPFTETLKRYPCHERSFALWKEGMTHGVFQPQFHGREHLNPQKWPYSCHHILRLGWLYLLLIYNFVYEFDANTYKLPGLTKLNKKKHTTFQ